MTEPPRTLIRSVLSRVRETMQTESRQDVHQLTFRAMSTPVRICFRQVNRALAADFERVALEWIAGFEARYSRFIPESIIGQINAESGGDWMEVDAETEELFSLCDQMHAFTRGVFDAAALPLMRLWDWKANPPCVADPEAIAAARHDIRLGQNPAPIARIELPSPEMGIDLGGIGKEYAVDRVLNMARERGMDDVLVDIGQDLRVSGCSPGKDAWYIGLEEPDQPGHCWTCVRLTDQAVATSGDYFRSFTRDGRRYGHILDPRSGEPVSNGCQAVTVIAPTCVIAGILSTVAFILGPSEGLELIKYHQGVEACITTDAARHQTRRFSTYVPA